MNLVYPTAGIAYIGPILMIIALVAMPVIGVFGGWKRAAYWGGGNLLFYIIGMLIWRFAGNNIAGLLNPVIAKFLDSTGVKADFTPLLNSIMSPLFFIIVLLLANIILVINYYAWFRRVSGIRKVTKIKNKNGTTTKKVVTDFKNNRSTGYKVMSHIVGGFGLTALMVPTILSFTQSTMYLTTSINNRQENKFANNVYNGINAVSNKVDWFSYYNNEHTGKDFDAVWAALYLATTNMDFNDVWEDEENEVQKMSIIKAIGITLDKGLGGIFGSTTNELHIPEEPTEEAVKAVVTEKLNDICASVDKLANAWNSLMEGDNKRAEKNIIALFTSESASNVVKQIIGIRTKDVKVGEKEIANYKEKNFFAWMVDLFQNGEVTFEFTHEKLPSPISITWKYEFVDFHSLDVNQKCYDNIREALVASYDLSELSDEDKNWFNTRMDQLLNILFF